MFWLLLLMASPAQATDAAAGAVGGGSSNSDKAFGPKTAATDRHLVAAWSDQPPYQFQAERRGIGHASGVDIAIVRLAAKRAGLTVGFRFQPFDLSLRLLEAGQIDLVPGAYDTAQRRGYATVSPAYRVGRERLFFPAQVSLPVADSVDALIARLIEREQSVALVRGYDWGTKNDAALKRLDAEGLVRWADSLSETVDLVLSGHADAFVGDQLVGLALLAQSRQQGFRMHPLVLQERPIHLLFAKGALSAWQLQAFNQALEELVAQGDVERIMQRFVEPMAIHLALGSRAFEVMFLVGIVAFSISGVVIARQGDYSIYGAFVLASLPALGGGVVRDILLLRPIYFFERPEMLYACLGTIFAGYLLNRVLDRLRGRSLWFFDLVNAVVWLRRRLSPRVVLEVFDAIGLALFTVIAVAIAAEEGLEPLWVWGPIIGAVSATGGAILRDMIRQEACNPMLHKSFYGETAMIWSVALAVFLQQAGPYASQQAVMLGILICMLGIFVTRMLFVAFDWRSPRY